MTNRTRQIIVVVAVFVIALASLGTIIGLLVNTGQLSEYSDGFRYELNGSKATIVGYTGNDDNVVVPDKVKGNRVVGIAKGAFDDTGVKSIKFNCTYPSFKIESEAFKELTTLEKVVLPAKLKEIPNGAFEDCKALNTVIIRDGLTKIGDNAFKNCTALKLIYNKENYSTEGAGAIKSDSLYLPSSLLEIGSYAFYKCGAIVGVHMSKDLEKIGSYAFYECTKFSDFELDKDSEITNIGDWAFYKTMLRSSESDPLSFPNLVSIGESAFKSIKSTFSYFALPASVKNIGSEAFAECSSVTKFSINGDITLDSMGEGVFQDCASLTYISLPAGIKEIPAKTFMGCYRLLSKEDFTISKNVEKIGDGAFAIYATDTTSNISSYLVKELKVEEDNEYFTIIPLEKFETSSAQGLLTDIDGSTVYAYYGAYDNESSTSRGETFRFLDKDGKDIKSITRIKAYAFAGVRFKNIQLPTTVEAVEDYIFFKSSIENCYSQAANWDLTNMSFSTQTDGEPSIKILLLKGAPNATEFRLTLGEYGLEVAYYTEPIDKN